MAMARVSVAIGEGEITPTEGEVLSNILVAHKDVVLKADLERRVDELELRISSKDGMPTLGKSTNLANRLNNLEQRVGPPDPSPDETTLPMILSDEELGFTYREVWW